MCRKAFASPKKFAALLGIPVPYVTNFAAILAVMNEKKAIIDPEGFEKHCDKHLEEKENDEKYSWNEYNPTVSLIESWYTNSLFRNKRFVLSKMLQ